MTDDPDDRLSAALGRLFGEISNLRRLSGGASQDSWYFEAGDRRLVLRRAASNFAGATLATVSMATEARLIRMAGEAGAPVPEIVHVLAEGDGLGEGFVSSFLAGEALGQRICRDPALASARTVFVEQCGANLAAIHSVDPAQLTGLQRTTPRTELDRMIAAYESHAAPNPVFALALAWLERHLVPPAPEAVLVHGDYRNGNLIVGPEGVRAVLDWEAAHIGDPAEDLSWFCAPSWRFGHADRPAGGVGSMEDLLASYTRASGREIAPERLRFWDAFSILRWGLICASAREAFASGADASPQRGIISRRASEAELDLLRLIAPR